MAHRAGLTLKFESTPAPALSDDMILELFISTQNAGNYYNPGAVQTAGSASGPNLASQNVWVVPKAMTVTTFRVDSANAAGDTSETYNFVKNGVATGDSVNVVNGTKVGSTTGLAIALAAGDVISWQLDGGASGGLGRTAVQLYATIP